MKNRLIIAALCLLLGPQLSQASTITWQWDGAVTSVSGGFPFGQLPAILPIGTPIRIAMSFESDAPNLCATPLHGNYLGHPAFITVGAHAFTSPLFLHVNSADGNCVLNVGVELRLPTWTPVTPGPDAALIAFAATRPALIGWGSPDGSLPTQLPSDPFPLSLIGPNFRASGQITAVPEPSTLLLFGGGIIALVRRRRRSSVDNI